MSILLQTDYPHMEALKHVESPENNPSLFNVNTFQSNLLFVTLINEGLE